MIPSKWRCFVILAIAAGNAFAADVQPVALRTESLSNPLGLDSPAPRLHWQLESGQRGVRQTAYRIVVASSPSVCASLEGDDRHQRREAIVNSAAAWLHPTFSSKQSNSNAKKPKT